MQVVVGLGNPGREHAGTRHNVGWRVADALARRLGARFARVPGRYDAAEAATDGGRLVLLKPLTYMNLSGDALRSFAARSGVRLGPPEAPGAVTPVVVCDDLNLPLGSLRVRPRGGAGGQKGLASILAALGSEDIPRVRLGIAPGGGVPPADWSDYVLAPFTATEREVMAELVAEAADAVLCLLQEGVEAAAGRFNHGPPPA